MKAIKSLLLIICFLSISSVAVYAGGNGCYCGAQSPGQGLVSDEVGFIVNDNIPINWYLSVTIMNEQPSGSATAKAWIQYGSSQVIIVTLTLSGMTYQTKDDSGTLWGPLMAGLGCSAQVYSGTGGGCSASASASW